MLKLSVNSLLAPALPPPAGGSMTPPVPQSAPPPAAARPSPGFQGGAFQAGPPLPAAAPTATRPPIPTAPIAPVPPPIPTQMGTQPNPIPTAPTSQTAIPTTTQTGTTSAPRPYNVGGLSLSIPTTYDQLQKLVPGLPTMDQTTAAVTDQTPPLSLALKGTGLSDVADGPLKWIQRGLSNPQGPQTFASFAGLLGKPAVEPLLNTPFGLPLLAGGYGLLRGGESFAAAKRLFGPALGRLGL